MKKRNRRFSRTAIPLRNAVSCTVRKKEADTERGQKRERMRERVEKRIRRSQPLFSLQRGCLSPNGEIDKKHCFAKCRGRLGLLAVADRAPAQGWKRQSFPGSYYCSRIYRERFVQPFRRHLLGTEPLSGTNAARYSLFGGFFVFVSHTMLLFREKFRGCRDCDVVAATR